MGDSSPLNIVGHGKVKIIFLDGRVKGIDGVQHIFDLPRNLLSVNKLSDVGVQVVSSSNRCKMTKGSMVLANIDRTGTLYRLDACMIKFNNTSV